jgi:hypothetical protein
MNNWGDPKYMVGEVDTYKKFPDYDLYGDWNLSRRCRVTASMWAGK